MRLLLALLLGYVVCAPAQADPSLPNGLERARASVVEIRVQSRNGTVHGSAVARGSGKLVTNCHVALGAERINVLYQVRRSTARLSSQHVERDICILEAPGVEAAVADRGSPLVPGETVYAIGFPAGREITVSKGEVVALHSYDGGSVIQVSAPFDYGSSGGGLFDQEGRLVGILTFKARAGGVFHFAAPVAWVDGANAGSAAALGLRPFWQRSGRDLPYFLRAASFEASANWNALAALALEWMRREPTDAGAPRAAAIAHQHRTSPPH